ncbi:hypothetical protein EVAR_26099_1 [Eumeta japonica]|uniref:Uncharacterized protein n=1 Tax=Eumeta variegata TaxID=151549 RepID=A0A4C1WXD8_EUMVA|nr:hypothetical protein EVAR_26099_1 [Eumeta japonica]
MMEMEMEGDEILGLYSPRSEKTDNEKQKNREELGWKHFCSPGKLMGRDVEKRAGTLAINQGFHWPPLSARPGLFAAAG